MFPVQLSTRDDRHPAVAITWVFVPGTAQGVNDSTLDRTELKPIDSVKCI